MPYIVTEPIKIDGTDLGFAVYPYQFSFLDQIRKGEESAAKLNIFQLKKTKFIEVEKVLYQKEFSLTMQTSNKIYSALKKFITQNGEYVRDVNAMATFFAQIDKSQKLFE